MLPLFDRKEGKPAKVSLGRGLAAPPANAVALLLLERAAVTRHAWSSSRAEASVMVVGSDAPRFGCGSVVARTTSSTSNLVVEVYPVQPATGSGGTQLSGVLPLTLLSVSVDVAEKL